MAPPFDELFTPGSSDTMEGLPSTLPTRESIGLASCETLKREIIGYCLAIHPKKVLSVVHSTASTRILGKKRLIECESRVGYTQGQTFFSLYQDVDILEEQVYLEAPFWYQAMFLKQLRDVVRRVMLIKTENGSKIPEDTTLDLGPETTVESLGNGSCQTLWQEVSTMLWRLHPGRPFECAFHAASFNDTNAKGEPLLRVYGQILCTDKLEGSPPNIPTPVEFYEAVERFEPNHYLQMKDLAHAALMRHLRNQVRSTMVERFGENYDLRKLE